MSARPSQRILDISRQLTWLGKSGWLNRTCFSILEYVLGFRTLNQIFTNATESATGLTYASRLLEELDISVKIEGTGESAIPETGPVVLVANHPFGGADAIAITALVLKNRPDSKILANEFLASIELLKPHLIAVDVYGGAEAVRKNRNRVREVIAHLNTKKMLAVFPAGEVSSWSMEEQRVTDPKWSDQIARLAEKTGATIVPVFVRGRNSVVFQILGLINPFLRTVWLGRELLSRCGKTVEIVIGKPFLMEPGINLRERVERLK